MVYTWSAHDPYDVTTYCTCINYMSSWFVFPTAYECNADLKPNSMYYPQGVVKLDLLILTPVA